jgi:hypothetical protein
MKIIMNVDFNEKLNEWTATGLTYDDSMDSPGILPTCNAESRERALELLLWELREAMELLSYRKHDHVSKKNIVVPTDRINDLPLDYKDDRKALRQEVKKLSYHTRNFAEKVIDLVQSVDEIESKIFSKVIEYVNRDR